ncbi:MAG: LacI family DNA-binding transcriptional regulator [Lachnospiraceae bacterium]|nr:LacI family DNA-binding transcriptional regulator [Lachnospiraceae bacterium]
MEQITIKDIARMCGCGVSTVSRALNNHPDINEATRKKIMKVVRETNFVPNNSARNLKLTESKTIAILVKGIANPSFMRMIKVMELEIQKQKYSLVIRHIDFDQDEVEVAVELEREKKLKGIVFLGGYFNHTKEKLDAISVPFVISTVNMTDEYSGNYSSVAVDDVRESYKIVDYLCKLGHKKILLISADPEDESIGKLRKDGYKKALEDNGIKPNEDLIIPMDCDEESYSMRAGFATMRKALESGVDFSAVYAVSDLVAIGACRALADAGKKVPEDISVAGFDGVDNAMYYSPRITTIEQPFDDMAKASIKLLFKYIEGEKSENQQRLFDGKLIIGESTAEYKK